MTLVSEKLHQFYDLMFLKYGPQNWWPGDSPWEICVGAVLTQNTNWNNVEKAVNNLKNSDCLKNKKILSINTQKLAEIIKPSGYYNIKAERLKNIAEWWSQNYINLKKLKNDKNINYWRKNLLNVNGIGQETADSILLYSFNLPTFVVDTYTKRIMARHFGTDPNISYEELRNLFMNNLKNKADFFNEFHALFVKTGKYDCSKNICRKSCPL